MGAKKINKRYLLIIFQLVFFVGFITLPRWYYKPRERAESYKGIIKDMYFNESTRQQWMFLIMTDTKVIHKLARDSSGEYAEIGDSIIKPAGKLMFIIKKPNGSYREFILE